MENLKKGTRASEWAKNEKENHGKYSFLLGSLLNKVALSKDVSEAWSVHFAYKKY